MKIYSIAFVLEGEIKIRADNAAEANEKFIALSKARLAELADPDLEADDPEEVTEE